MNGFKKENLIDAYQLVNGNVALVCTKGVEDGLYNVTPYGWFTVFDYEPVTRVLFSADPTHQSVANIERTRQFAICIPTDEKDPIIEKCGSVSSPTSDKFEMFGINGEKASKIDVKLLPENSKAMIEFKLVRVIEEGSVKIIMGEAVEAWKKA